MGIPLGVRDERKGFLILERGTRVFEANDLELATMFAGQGSMAIENARLFAQVNHLATTDELTGVASRRHFYYLAEREVSRAKRHRHPLVVMMADVDHFKTVNDTYGHGIGDAVLKTVASRLSRSLRDADLLGRYGGEEFVFLLPETELETAKDLIAERLREAIAGPGIETESGSIRVTVSVGVCGDPAGESSLTELLKGADAALYAAKRAGRNCVVGGSVAFPASGGSS